MRISSKLDRSVPSGSAFATERRGSPEVDNSSSTTVSDSVTVSFDARLMMEANVTAQQAQDVRQEKVDALRIQVQNGTYQPDSRLIAQNLLREEQGLFLL